MLYREFNQYEPFLDSDNPQCNAYKTSDGHVFYVEPGFYEGLLGYQEKRPDRYSELLDGIYSVIEKNQRLVLTGDFERPFVKKADFIYREITDIADALCIYVEDKSRGSDYGD